ncbi:MAG: Inositol 2-dehydrogenase/D-chiro-inositol 3-dehydrogenase [bacterium]|nr:Inositol 2-dehydrogenase/D-chiro-inositol 3-dehydrogenase [bacterium]
MKRNLVRRNFLKTGAGAAALSFTLARPEWVFGAAANSKLEIGIIGSGGRGKWIANLFEQHGGYKVVACADYFQERVDDLGEKYGVEPTRRHTGLSGYKKLLESKLDAVAIESPPCFHPEQAAAAVAAGKHAFVAKPIAVDVPGCQSIEASGKAATAKKLAFLIDFQSRTDPFFIEAVGRVRQGEIGKIVSGQAAYLTGRLGLHAEPGSPEARLKNWVFDKALSGDIITEQNIHALDIATWILDAAPLCAVGRGGRKLRVDVGDCWDHFEVIFDFPEDIVLSFHSKQCGRGADDIMARVYGETGTIDAHYGGVVNIKGDKPYEGGETKGIFTDGAVRNIATFHESITKGDFSNPTVAPSVRSNLTTILGRTAAYTGKEVTWEEMMRTGEELDLQLEGLAG